MSVIRRDGPDLVLTCYLQPRASKDELCGLHDDALRIRIKAPPVDGEANQALIRFLAKQFSVSRQDVRIESGTSSRRKRIRVVAPGRIPERVQAWMADAD